MNDIYAWALSFITASSPANQTQFVKEAKETEIEGLARRESIARDVVDAVYSDPAPPLFSGPYGRAQTVPVVLSIMEHEGGFRRDVDLGVGSLSRGDSGRSWCLMQLNIGGGRTGSWNTVKNRFALNTDPPEEIVQGWTGKELVADRKKCVIAGLRVIRQSFSLTSGLAVGERLRVYVSGKPDCGSAASQKRMGTAIRWYGAHAAPLTDDKAYDLLFPKRKEEDKDALLNPVKIWPSAT